MRKEEREARDKEKFSGMSVYENELRSRGCKYIAGVDEVGRGPLAGPVIAAAVVLPSDFLLLGIDDSKKLSEKKRKEFSEIISAEALAIGYGIVDEKKIDEINILEATKLAMTMAIKNAEADINIKLFQGKSNIGSDSLIEIDHILIDALTLPQIKTSQTPIIKGDGKSISIAAASILAKVNRDNLMEKYHKVYPAYAFDKNKGYGTKLHYEGIETYGVCPIHRRSFIKKYI